jgi:hypothetical protein
LASWPAFISMTRWGMFRGTKFRDNIFIRHSKPFCDASQCPRQALMAKSWDSLGKAVSRYEITGEIGHGGCRADRFALK